jgi:hypothetical protein
MVSNTLRMMAIVLCLVGVSRSDDVTPKVRTDDSKSIEGLWFGFWGGGGANGVIFQPAKAELFIQGNHMELYGFHDVGRLTGTVRFDARTKQMHITPSAKAGGQPGPKAIDYLYEIKADELTLIGSDRFSITLQRHRVVENPLANARVEFVAAAGIDDAGDLLVTEFTVLRAGRAGTAYSQPVDRSLKTKLSTILLAHETGLQKITVDEARGLIRASTPVVVTYRHDDHPLPHQSKRSMEPYSRVHAATLGLGSTSLSLRGRTVASHVMAQREFGYSSTRSRWSYAAGSERRTDLCWPPGDVEGLECGPACCKVRVSLVWGPPWLHLNPERSERRHG